MSTFKRIKFFECDPIEDANSQGQQKQAKGRGAKPVKEEQKQSSDQKTIQDIRALRMVYLDMFFLILGSNLKNPGDTSEYFYLTKNLQVKGEFKIHSQTYYVDKFINYQKGMKLLISLGLDQITGQGEEVDQILVIKIWDFQSLVQSSNIHQQSIGYIERGKAGLTGGTYLQKQQFGQNETMTAQGEMPRMIPITYNGKNYTDQIKAFRVSRDGVIGAVVLKTNDILIYRVIFILTLQFIDSKGDFVNEKQAIKPVRVIKIKETQYQDVIDLFIYRRQEQVNSDYHMYLVATNGVLVYTSVEKKDDGKSISDDSNLVMTRNCSDCDSRGQLLIDAAQKHKEASEHFIKKFSGRNSLTSHSVEGTKDLLRFFKDHVVEVKQVKTGQQISIYDFKNQMTLFCNSYNNIQFVEVEEDAIYMLTSNQKDQKTLYKLHEMEDNIKIQTLLKKGLYQEAQKIAQSANFPQEIVAEICKEYADNLYEKKSPDQALEQFVKTIGYLNPSYVIQRYIDVSQLPNLIKYLEELVKTPTSQQQQHNLTTLADYNKDYTALLLNCYVKTKQKDKISELIKKYSQNNSDTIFDVGTAIEVCRQQLETLEQAEELAKQSKQWKLLVQIQIENKKDNEMALHIIDKNINNLKEKVECLQLYGPKLIKQKDFQDKLSRLEKNSKRNLAAQVKSLALDIVSALIEYSKHGKFLSDNYKRFQLKRTQKIRIEDLLQIFVDDIEQMKDFLQSIIERYGLGGPSQADLEKLTQLNLYHRLLECYLYLNQANQTTQFFAQIKNKSNIGEEINRIIERYDSKIDKHYVLFLFNIYNYSEGVQGCCERLELKQELLNYYIQKKDKDKVLEVCKKYDNKKDSENVGDLWIQALTFFRDLDDEEKLGQKTNESEKYMELALDHIGKNNILSPLLILEIVQKKPTLKFKVLKKYLLDRLEAQDKVIKKNNKKVEENMSKIGEMRKEITELKTTAKNFNQKECSNCDQKLSLPTVHFMCGHTYHDYCVESEEFQEIIDKKDQFAQQTKDTEQFYKELNQDAVKFNVVANYFGRGLFNELDKHFKEQIQK